jgi:hypothetical protein
MAVGVVEVPRDDLPPADDGGLDEMEVLRARVDVLHGRGDDREVDQVGDLGSGQQTAPLRSPVRSPPLRKAPTLEKSASSGFFFSSRDSTSGLVASKAP